MTCTHIMSTGTTCVGLQSKQYSEDNDLEVNRLVTTMLAQRTTHSPDQITQWIQCDTSPASPTTVVFPALPDRNEDDDRDDNGEYNEDEDDTVACPLVPFLIIVRLFHLNGCFLGSILGFLNVGFCQIEQVVVLVDDNGHVLHDSVHFTDSLFHLGQTLFSQLHVLRLCPQIVDILGVALLAFLHGNHGSVVVGYVSRRCVSRITRHCSGKRKRGNKVGIKDGRVDSLVGLKASLLGQ